MEVVSPQVPHLIVSSNPRDRGYVAMVGSSWSLRAHADDAFVFPSAVLAERWAKHLSTEYAGPFEVQAAADRRSHVLAEAYCGICGCIDTFACPDRCHWTAPGLCSSCAETIRIELEKVFLAQPDDPAMGDAMSFGEGKALALSSKAFNVAKARKLSEQQADASSEAMYEAVMVIALAVEKRNGHG